MDTTHLLYRAGLDSYTSRALKNERKQQAGWRCQECNEVPSRIRLHAHHATLSTDDIIAEALRRSGLSSEDLRKQYDRNDPAHRAFRDACDDIHLNGLNGQPVVFEVLCAACHKKKHMPRA